MSTAARLIKAARRRTGINQARHATLAGTSQARLSTYESGAVDPTVGTLERLLAPAGLQLEAAPALTFEDRRSLAFGAAIADQLDDGGPELVGRARTVLARMVDVDRRSGGHAEPLLRIWGALLDLGPSTCAGVLRSRDALASTLRSASPFAGLLTNAQCTDVVRRTRSEP